MATTAPPRPTDDFDMTKLQKSLKQRQRHSIRNSPHVAKLTPAEIRSLNHNALASKAGSQSSSKTSSSARSRHSINATPSASPNHSSVPEGRNHKDSVSRKPSLDIPTPPITPSGHRRSSKSSTQGHTPSQSQTNGTIHSPRPRGSAQAAFMVANGVPSRPSSSGSSKYRGLPTYRGPEVTRTGSMNMLPRPAPDIVTNPLSYFSRPRQSMVSSSPDHCRHNSPDYGGNRAQSLRSTRTDSLPNHDHASSRPVSPLRVTDSPVSMLVYETEKFPVLDVEDPHNQPKIHCSDECNKSDVKWEQVQGERNDNIATPVVEQDQTPQAEPPRKGAKKRYTIGVAIFGKDKNISDGSDNAGKLKKLRRRTMSFTKKEVQMPSNDETHHDHAMEVKVDGATIEDTDFATHPAVRPLSLIIPGEFKGKEKEIDAGPVYARCSCCGRLKRPPGYSGELSPVMENENLRTNFSFEIERTSPTAQRRSSDANRDKFTPIIPMEPSGNETRQASIEPYTVPASPASVSSPSNNTSPRKSKRHSDPPRFVRFGSLHGRRNVDPTIINEEDEMEAENKAPLENDRASIDMAAAGIQDVATVEDVVRSQGVIEADETRAFVEPEFCVSSSATELAEYTHQGSPMQETESAVFATPAHEASPTIEIPPVKMGTSIQAMSSSYQTQPLLSLPEPSFGPDFARSNTILRNFVLESNRTAPDHGSTLDMGLPGPVTGRGGVTVPAMLNQTRAQVMDRERRKGQKWVAEVMAV